MSPIVAVIAGSLLLLAGRRLFWLFIAIIGFLFGVELASELVASRPDWIVWVIGALAGVVGALVAIFFQRLAFALAGFYAGSYLAIIAAQSLGWPTPNLAVFFVGGVSGAVVAAIVMDWAIIVLSSLAGAGMIVEALGLAPLHRIILSVVLVALGIVVQSKTPRGRLERRPRAP